MRSNIIKFLMILGLSFGLTGCSLLPRITFDRPGTTPQSTEKSSARTQCAGELKTNPTTGEVSCTKGYYSNEQNYKQAERAYTLAERVGNFIRSLAGWGFWGLVLLVILCPGVIGWLIGRVFNIFRSALTGTVKAIGDFKNNIPKVIIDGKETYDPAYLKAVDDLFDELENAHSKDPAILKKIAQIRVELKIADND